MSRTLVILVAISKTSKYDESFILPWVKPVKVKYPHVAKSTQINTDTKMDIWMMRDHLATVGSSKEP